MLQGLEAGLRLGGSGPSRAIARSPGGVTAFVGRTLKGPLDRVVRVNSFDAFEQLFGGLWQPSCVSYAVEQYFENGGREALIVRVASGARAPTLTLPAGAGQLRLTGLNPGSREYLRAAVDYDGLPDAADGNFNLVIQRLSVAGSERVSEQEILRRVSIDPGSPRCVTALLAGSQLVRVTGPLPAQRPDSTHGSGGAVGYVRANTDGDDGAPLCDYDLIGSQSRRTGLFALGPDDDFDLMYLPPLTRERDLGLSTLLVAGRVCRARHALLVVDPPRSWVEPAELLAGMASWPFHSDHAAMFFPRVLATDRLRNRVESFAPGAAAAGLLSRGDALLPQRAGFRDLMEAALRPGLKPAHQVSAADSTRLAQAGVNTLVSLRPAGSRACGTSTLAAGRSAGSEGRYLSMRRQALRLAACIETGTRWVLEAPNTPATHEQAGRQLQDLLASLHADGAFAGGRFEDCCQVVWDQRVNRTSTMSRGAVNLLYGIAQTRCGDLSYWLVTHEPVGSRVRPVAVNQLAAGRPAAADWAVATGVLMA